MIYTILITEQRQAGKHEVYMYSYIVYGEDKDDIVCTGGIYGSQAAYRRDFANEMIIKEVQKRLQHMGRDYVVEWTN